MFESLRVECELGTHCSSADADCFRKPQTSGCSLSTRINRFTVEDSLSRECGWFNALHLLLILSIVLDRIVSSALRDLGSVEARAGSRADHLCGLVLDPKKHARMKSSANANMSWFIAWRFKLSMCCICGSVEGTSGSQIVGYTYVVTGLDRLVLLWMGGLLVVELVEAMSRSQVMLQD